LSVSESAKLKQKTVATWSAIVAELNWDWIKFMKHKLAAFYSYHLNQVIPNGDDPVLSRDKPQCILGGKAFRWQRRLFFQESDNLHFLSYLSTILLSKKGMPLPGKEECEKADKKTVETLTTVKPDAPAEDLLDWGSAIDGVEHHLSKTSVVRQLKRTVKEIFGGLVYTDKDRYQPFFPSTSANYINSRKGAGAIGAILDDPALMHGLREPGGSLIVEKVEEKELRDKGVVLESIENKVLKGVVTELSKWKTTKGPISRLISEPLPEHLIKDITIATSKSGMVLVRPLSLEEETKDERREEEYSFDDTSLKTKFRTLMKRTMEGALEEPPIVKSVALPEALKVRIISKGPPLTYTALRPIWKFMHSTLRNHKTFTLIGKPDSEEVILNLLGKELKDKFIYLSGDYKAATDNIRSWVSNVVAEAISDEIGLTDSEKELFVRALTEHWFDLGDGETFEDMKEQKSGQLMGSIVSFPILCIINASMCRWAMELAEGKVKRLHHCALGVNGDDVILKSHESVYGFWHKITSFVGLEESIGKTFQSRKFLNINSKTYKILQEPKKILCNRLDGDGTVLRDCPFNEVPYVNMGAMFGRNRAGNAKLSDQDDPRATLSSKAHTLLQFCPQSLKERVMRRFIEKNRNLLNSTGLPWFIPEWLGGLGLPNILPEFKNSELDLRQARHILLNWKRKKPIHLAQGHTPWAVRQQAHTRLPDPFQTSDKDSLAIQAWNQVTALKTVDLLFNSEVQLHDMFDNGLDVDYDPVTGIGSLEIIQKPSRTQVSTAIRHNQSLWRPKSGKLPEPLEEGLLGGLTRFDGIRISKFGKRPPPVAPLPLSMKRASALMESHIQGALRLD